MTETYTQEELARAWKDLDTTLTSYNMDRLERICVQARKNRLWEAHGNLEQAQSPFFIDESEMKEPIVFTADGPILFSQVPERFKKAAVTKDLSDEPAAG